MSWLLENTVGAVLLAALALALARWAKPSPAIAHVLWLAVVVKLMAPPLLPCPVLPAWSAALPSPEPEPLAPLGAGPTAAAMLAGGAPPRSELALTAADAASPSPRRLGWKPAALAVWALGAAVVAAIAWRSARRVRRALRLAQPPSARLAAAVDAAARALGTRAPPVRVAAVGSPFIWGLGKPVLVWPAADGATDAGSRAVLAHELAHLRRGDHWVARFELIAAMVLWWHPLFWLARAQMRHEAELACDAWALWAVPDARHEYAGALIDALENEILAAPALAALGVQSANRRAFERRLNLILHERTPRRLSAWSLGPIAAVALVLAAGPTFAQERAPEQEAAEAAHRALEREIEAAVRKALTRHGAAALPVEVRIGGTEVLVPGEHRPPDAPRPSQEPSGAYHRPLETGAGSDCAGEASRAPGSEGERLLDQRNRRLLNSAAGSLERGAHSAALDTLLQALHGRHGRVAMQDGDRQGGDRDRLLRTQRHLPALALLLHGALDRSDDRSAEASDCEREAKDRQGEGQRSGGESRDHHQDVLRILHNHLLETHAGARTRRHSDDDAAEADTDARGARDQHTGELHEYLMRILHNHLLDARSESRASRHGDDDVDPDAVHSDMHELHQGLIRLLHDRILPDRLLPDRLVPDRLLDAHSKSSKPRAIADRGGERVRHGQGSSLGTQVDPQLLARGMNPSDG